MPLRCRAPCTTASRTSTVCSGQITMSPSSRGPALGASSSTPKDSTSVGRSICRYSRLSSRLRPASTNSIATWPSSIPAEESASAHSSSSSTAVGPLSVETSIPITSTSSIRRFLRALTGPQLGRQALGVLVIGGHDPPHELVAHDVLVAETHELHVLHVVKDVGHRDQPGRLLAREV